MQRDDKRSPDVVNPKSSADVFMDAYWLSQQTLQDVSEWERMPHMPWTCIHYISYLTSRWKFSARGYDNHKSWGLGFWVFHKSGWSVKLATCIRQAASKLLSQTSGKQMTTLHQIFNEEDERWRNDKLLKLEQTLTYKENNGFNYGPACMTTIFNMFKSLIYVANITWCCCLLVCSHLCAQMKWKQLTEPLIYHPNNKLTQLKAIWK